VSVLAGPLLFVRGGALGDFVLTLPLLRALFDSGREVHVACARRHLPLVAATGTPARTWDLDGVESLWMFGGRDPVGYAAAWAVGEGRASLPVAGLHTLAARPPPGVSAATHFAPVLPAGLPTPDPSFRLQVRPLRGDAPVVLAPGASDPARSWPLRRWFGLAARLRDLGRPVVVVGGPAEPWADYRPELSELMGLAASVSAWIGPDSGPTHLAARCGASTAAVFGPTDRAWAPAGASVFDADEPDDTLVAWVRRSIEA
jgi:hypothetical protein